MRQGAGCGRHLPAAWDPSHVALGDTGLVTDPSVVSVADECLYSCRSKTGN